VRVGSPSLDGRRFRDVSEVRVGDVEAATLFEYHEHADGTISACYQGGAVRMGYLVGTRSDDQLTFRHVHLTVDGETAGGRCTSIIEQIQDGRLRLVETWRWESKPGEGTSVVEEIK
jgi:hypothetical protein